MSDAITISEENGQEVEEIQEGLIEIPEQEDVKEEINLTDGMSEDEIKEAKELGLLTEEKEDDSSNDKEKKGEEESEEDEINTDPDNFEEMDSVIEKDEKKFHEKYTRNQKALYFKMKAEKEKRQAYKKQLDEQSKLLEELKATKNSGDKLKKISELLNKPLRDGETLTIEELNDIINEKVEIVEKDDGVIKPQEVSEKVNNKLSYAVKIGSAMHDNFVEISKLAEELAIQKPVYKNLIADAVYSDDIDETALAQQIIDIAKLHPKYNEVSGKEPEKKVVKDSRVITNSKKKISSAAIGGSKRGRLVSEDNLTAEDLEVLMAKDPKAVDRLKPETIDRILRQSS